MHRLICSCFFALFLFLATPALLWAQDPVRIKEIPFPMTWENKPVSYVYAGGILSVEAGAKTDMFRDPQATYNTDNAPKLLFKADSNFVFIAAIEHPFSSKWDGGAIVIRSDSLHWVKFCYEKDYLGAHRVVSVVTRNISDDCNSVSFTSNKVYYKVAKSGQAITLYCSENKKDWLLVRHFQLNTAGPVKLGLLAQSPDGPGTTVLFSEIEYKAIKIKDPYAGE